MKKFYIVRNDMPFHCVVDVPNEIISIIGDTIKELKNTYDAEQYDDNVARYNCDEQDLIGDIPNISNENADILINSLKGLIEQNCKIPKSELKHLTINPQYMVYNVSKNRYNIDNDNTYEIENHDDSVPITIIVYWKKVGDIAEQFWVGNDLVKEERWVNNKLKALIMWGDHVCDYPEHNGILTGYGVREILSFFIKY
jgi:hypothetical protein